MAQRKILLVGIAVAILVALKLIVLAARSPSTWLLVGLPVVLVVKIYLLRKVMAHRQDHHARQRSLNDW